MICISLAPLPPHPRATSLNLKCERTYNIRVGSGGGCNSEGATPNVSLHNSDQSSLALAIRLQARETQDARERVGASQKERIRGTTSEIKAGMLAMLPVVLGGSARRSFRRCTTVEDGRGRGTNRTWRNDTNEPVKCKTCDATTQDTHQRPAFATIVLRASALERIHP